MQKRTTSININDKPYRFEYWYQASALTVYSGTVFTEPEIDFNFPVDGNGVIQVDDRTARKQLFYSLLAVIQDNEKVILKKSL